MHLTLSAALISQIAPYLAAVLTVLIFSYLLGDNFLYRIAVHLLIGAAAGYALIVAFEAVLIPWWRAAFAQGIFSPNAAFGIFPLLIGVLLAFKLSPRLARFGNLGLAVVLGVGDRCRAVGRDRRDADPAGTAGGQPRSGRSADRRDCRDCRHGLYVAVLHLSGRAPSERADRSAAARSRAGKSRPDRDRDHTGRDIRASAAFRPDRIHGRGRQSTTDFTPRRVR